MVRRKITSVEKLAELTQSEFVRLDSKVDMGFREIVDVLKIMRDDLGLIRDDPHDIKITLGPLVRMMADLENSDRHLGKRVSRLEEKAGFAK